MPSTTKNIEILVKLCITRGWLRLTYGTSASCKNTGHVADFFENSTFVSLSESLKKLAPDRSVRAKALLCLVSRLDVAQEPVGQKGR